MLFASLGLCCDKQTRFLVRELNYVPFLAGTSKKWRSVFMVVVCETEIRIYVALPSKCFIKTGEFLGLFYIAKLETCCILKVFVSCTETHRHWERGAAIGEKTS